MRALCAHRKAFVHEPPGTDLLLNPKCGLRVNNIAGSKCLLVLSCLIPLDFIMIAYRKCRYSSCFCVVILGPPTIRLTPFSRLRRRFRLYPGQTSKIILWGSPASFELEYSLD